MLQGIKGQSVIYNSSTCYHVEHGAMDDGLERAKNYLKPLLSS